MKKIFYLFLILNIGFLSAQIEKQYLIDTWFVAKVNMKDGSEIFLKETNYLENYGFRFEKDTYEMGEVKSLGPKSSFQISYRLVNNELQTSPGSSLVIEKLTADSLILSQKIQNIEDVDLQRYHLIPYKKMILERAEIFKDKDTLVANSIFGPTFKKNLSLRTIREITNNNPYLKNPILTFRFNGHAILDLQHRKVTVILKDFSPKFQSEIDEKIEPLKTFSNWNIYGFKDFKYLKIPFAFVHYYEKKPEVESFGDLYKFNTDDFNKVFISTEIGLANIEESNRYFNSALKEYQRKNFKEAIIFFEKSYKTNPKNLNAYYNYAEIQFSTGSRETACETYEFLKDQGQKPAEKIFLEKCQK